MTTPDLLNHYIVLDCTINHFRQFMLGLVIDVDERLVVVQGHHYMNPDIPFRNSRVSTFYLNVVDWEPENNDARIVKDYGVMPDLRDLYVNWYQRMKLDFMKNYIDLHSEPVNENNYAYGFISPDGKYYPFDMTPYHNTNTPMVRDIFFPELILLKLGFDMFNKINPLSLLVNSGWCIVDTTKKDYPANHVQFYKHHRRRLNSRRFITDKQGEVVFKICELADLPIDIVIYNTAFKEYKGNEELYPHVLRGDNEKTE